MYHLLKTNIKQSITSFPNKYKLPSNIIFSKNNQSKINSNIDSGSAIRQFVPLFYKKKQKIECLQKEYFGLYALTTIIRHTLISVPFLKAALEPESIPFTPGIMLNYRGLFHLIIAYLALNGRALITKQGPVFQFPFNLSSESKKESEKIKKRIEELRIKEIDKDTDRIMAILTKSNKWIYENRDRSHTVIWKEIGSVLKKMKKIPDAFLEIFKYLTTYGPYSLDNKEEIIEYGIKEIAKARHLAAYNGFGSDDLAVDLTMEGESDISKNAFSYKLKAYSKFSNDLLNIVTLDLIDLIRSIGSSSRNIRWHIYWILTNPPHPPEYHYLPGWPGSSILKDRIIKITNWIFEDIFPQFVRDKDGNFVKKKINKDF